MKDIDEEFRRRLAGEHLITAEIIYRMPDRQSLLQSFVHQMLDWPPRFPRLRRFIDFWMAELDGPIHSVRVTSSGLLAPVSFRPAAGQWDLR